MTTQIPSEFVPFVRKLVSEGRFASESEVLGESLRLLAARESLREDVREGFAQLRAGKSVSLEEANERARERIRQIERGEA